MHALSRCRVQHSPKLPGNFRKLAGTRGAGVEVQRLCAATHLGGEARVVHAQQHLVGIAHSACSTRSGAAKGTDNAVKGTKDAVKGTDNAVKGTEDVC